MPLFTIGPTFKKRRRKRHNYAQQIKTKRPSFHYHHGVLGGFAVLKSRDCGSLRTDDVGIEITLAGWVHRRRDHGGLIFIDLRDSTGLVQIVFQPTSDEAFGTAEQFRSEWVVQIQGHLRFRPRGTENPNMPTGEVEVLATSACVLNSSKTPPFEIGQDVHVDEQLRMRYRYLDLRRESMRANLRLRHRITKFIRDYLDVLGFTEIETPILNQ